MPITDDSGAMNLPEVIAPPSYTTLLSWWEAWPEAKPAHLDFWARGNYTRRLLSRHSTGRTACIVRAQYIDEMEWALKRLALLDIDVDFGWCGEVSEPGIVIVPQAADYGDSGGWGYNACAGDIDRRGGKEWCPSVGWARLLPDTVTDWLSGEASEFFRSGKVMVAPIGHIGLSKNPGAESEERLQRMSESITLMRESAKIRTVLSLELPCIEGMSLRDMHAFCEDHRDSLMIFQGALRRLLRNTPPDSEDALVRELAAEINEGVAVLRLSDKAQSARKDLTALGASVGTFLMTLGIKLGVVPGAVAAGSAGAAIGVISQISQILESRGQMRKSPFYAVWALQRGKGPKNQFRQRPSYGETSAFPAGRGKDQRFHWLTPPTAGWSIPSVLRGHTTGLGV